MCLLIVVSTASAQSEAPELLPDLDQVTPGQLNVKRVSVRGQTRFRLGFLSASENRGAGPLTLHGFRPDLKTHRMQVDQLVRREDGSTRLIREVGGMRYVVHPDHRHWHFIGFARYELRRVGAKRGTVRWDRKTGFCLGDRYRIRGAKKLAGFRPFPAQGDTCGRARPGLTGLFAGISVGYGDAYAAHLEGQYIDITTARAGRYLLIHTANPDRTLAESNYENNASSLLLSLRWRHKPKRHPIVRVVRRCPGTELCRGKKPSTTEKVTPTRR